MEIDRPLPGIIILRRFMDEDECATYVARAEAANRWVAAPIGRYQDNKLIESRVNRDIRDVEVCGLEEIGITFPTPAAKALRLEINRELDVPVDVMSRGMISKYTPGSHIRPHRDTGMYSTNRIVTCVAYLNDGYSGGALTFPDLAFEFLPARGDCICFYSEFKHGVAEITAGVRYCIVWFGESDSVATR